MKRLTLAFVLLGSVVCVVALKAQAPNPADIKVAAPQEAAVEEAAGPLFGMVLGPLREDGSRECSFRKDSVGQRVTVEGIAWGQPFSLEGQVGTVSPWAGPHVIHQGGSIFVKGIDFTQTKARGKPVRVTGMLKLEPEHRTNFSPAAGLKPYYYIEATTFESIEAVTDPHVVLAKE